MLLDSIPRRAGPFPRRAHPKLHPETGSFRKVLTGQSGRCDPLAGAARVPARPPGTLHCGLGVWGVGFGVRGLGFGV